MHLKKFRLLSDIPPDCGYQIIHTQCRFGDNMAVRTYLLGVATGVCVQLFARLVRYLRHKFHHLDPLLAVPTSKAVFQARVEEYHSAVTDLQLGYQIGKGSFGRVFEGKMNQFCIQQAAPELLIDQTKGWSRKLYCFIWTFGVSLGEAAVYVAYNQAVCAETSACLQQNGEAVKLLSKS